LTDLVSRRSIVAKGVLFAVMIVASAALLFAGAPSARTAFLLATLVWSAARFYYFLFYVLEKYVDPRLRYAGIWALLRALWQRRAKPPRV
jgi:hypothetical protein